MKGIKNMKRFKIKEEDFETRALLLRFAKIPEINLDKLTPKMSKKLFNDLKKFDLIFASEKLRQIAIEKYGNCVVTFWKFNIDKMKKMSY